MKALTIATAAASALVLTACGSVYDREPAYEPAPRVEREPAPAPTGGYESHRAADRMLHDKVHNALARAPSLRGTDIAASVEGSRVYLSGTVDSPRQRQTAHDVVHSIDGVASVMMDDLRVRY